MSQSAKLKELISRVGLRVDTVDKMLSESSPIQINMEIEPIEFLDRAEDDLELGGSAAHLNAVSNAKRAIACRIDEILLCFGLHKKGLSTKRKIELLDAMGFLNPRILRRVSATRNLLEHEWRRPKMQDVEDAIDLAALFLEATGRHLDSFCRSFGLGSAGNELIYGYRDELTFESFDSESGFYISAVVNRVRHGAPGDRLRGGAALRSHLSGARGSSRGRQAYPPAAACLPEAPHRNRSGRLTPRCSGRYPGVRPGSAAELISR